jgi:ABC-type glycerol-3-phosphate transport system permease component
MVGRGLIYVILIGLSVAFSLPFLWSLSASLKSLDQIFVPGHWIPHPVRIQNYARIFDHIPFHLFFLNSLIVTVGCLTGQLLSSSMVAFSFARLQWRGREFFFVLMLSTLMLPGAVTMIPTFILFKHLGWINTFTPLILPSFLGGGAFNIFLLRQFFKTIPVDLEDAARIDGCSNLRILFSIMIPLAKPALATIAVLSFIGHWNDFLDPLIYLDSYRKFTVAIGINMFKDAYSIFPHYLMAASMMALAPVLILFLASQRYIVKGIVLTGMKG